MQSSIQYKWPGVGVFQENNIFSDYVRAVFSDGFEDNEWLEELRYANDQKGFGVKEKNLGKCDFLNNGES